MIEGSETQQLKNLCEQEKTQIFTVLMLSMGNPRLAGYNLTGIRPMFLSTDGSLAWLYPCPLMRYPPQVLNQCYDKIPIFDKNAIFFVDPITRQTYPDAQIQNYTEWIRISFNSTWKTKTHGSLLHPLKNRVNDQHYLDQNM